MVHQRRDDRNPWIPSMNWHVTLGFFGEQPEGATEELAEVLGAAARGTPSFELSLAGAGTFRHDVCWIGVSDPAGALGPLAEKVRGTRAVQDQHARNRFHVTVSRSGRQAGLGNIMAALSIYHGPAWTVHEISLFRSDLGGGVGGHPLYTPLATAQLGEPHPSAGR